MTKGDLRGSQDKGYSRGTHDKGYSRGTHDKGGFEGLSLQWEIKGYLTRRDSRGT